MSNFMLTRQNFSLAKKFTIAKSPSHDPQMDGKEYISETPRRLAKIAPNLSQHN